MVGNRPKVVTVCVSQMRGGVPDLEMNIKLEYYGRVGVCLVLVALRHDAKGFIGSNAAAPHPNDLQLIIIYQDFFLN